MERYRMNYCDKYYEWVEWNKDQKHPLSLMTNVQANFLNWLLVNAKDQLIQLGNLKSVFGSAQKFLKEDNRRRKRK